MNLNFSRERTINFLGRNAQTLTPADKPNSRPEPINANQAYLDLVEDWNRNRNRNLRTVQRSSLKSKLVTSLLLPFVNKI